jgi:hypothetical protein
MLGIGGVALSSFACIHASEVATVPARPDYRASLLSVDGEVVLPSQRPRYLSAGAGSGEYRFSPNAGENDWGLGPITPDEGIVVMRPGEYYDTAANADLGARAAGATHGHGLVAPAVAMAE